MRLMECPPHIWGWLNRHQLPAFRNPPITLWLGCGVSVLWLINKIPNAELRLAHGLRVGCNRQPAKRTRDFCRGVAVDVAQDQAQFSVEVASIQAEVVFPFWHTHLLGGLGVDSVFRFKLAPAAMLT